MTSFLRSMAGQAMPRILTQICRDPGSPFYGCADRNWWHYKVRDFPSIILQQAGYALAVAAESPLGGEDAAYLRGLAAAACRFWNGRAVRRGAFEEYYPYEQGYPPLAFSALAVAKILLSGAVSLEDVYPGLKVASKQLLSRFESKASNQQVAGTAAVAAIRSAAPGLVDERAFSNLLDRTLGLQTSEGWFPEYDGPDLGYLTVAMDCLFDLLDFTKDERCRTAIESAFDFVSWFVLGPFGRAGMHNARNTDYFVPYALARLTAENWSCSGDALTVFERLFDPPDPEKHFLSAVDDRYWCHYVGHSVLRAIPLLEGRNRPSVIRSGFGRIASEKMQSGHMLLGFEEDVEITILLSTLKGGIFTAKWRDEAWASDYGWQIEQDGKLHVTHWWSKDWRLIKEDDAVGCCGNVVPHREHESAPLKHVALRMASFFAGRRIIEPLKNLLIFKNNSDALYFERRIKIEENALLVEDRIDGLKDAARVTRAPRSSKRHVASADSFHYEDIRLSQGVTMQEKIHREGSKFLSLTHYLPVSESNRLKSRSAC